MPKIPKAEFDDIIETIANFQEDVSIEEIGKALTKNHPELTLDRRALQRRLHSLLLQKKLLKRGTKRGTRYRLAEGNDAEKRINDELPVSRESQSIRKNLRRPLTARKYVGYNRDFLSKYHPNETFYLSQSVREHLASVGHPPNGELPAGTYARQVFNRLLIDLSWNSSRLEGNTYSLLETELLLKAGEGAEGKTLAETQMIVNHKAAIELLVEGAEEIAFNRITILNLHSLLSDNLLHDQAASGRLRQREIGITGSVYEPLQVPQLVEECFLEILEKATAITDPFEQSFFAMVHIPYLQPFEDVNKRVARLAANIPFIKQNLSPLSFVGVPRQDYIEGILGIYELNRTELMHDVFVWAYERSCERYAAILHSLGEPDPFRLRHRNMLIQVVGEVVKQGMGKKEAVSFIRASVAPMPIPDRDRMMELVETELQSLHEGNFARFKIRPSEFEAWQKNWG